MSQSLLTPLAAEVELDDIVSAPFFYRGELVEGADQIHRSRDLGVRFATPRIEFDKAVPPRTEVPPLLNVPLSEIIDFLIETGQALKSPGNVHLQECLDRMAATHILPSKVVQRTIEYAVDYLDRRTVCVNGFSIGRLLVDRTPSYFTIVDIGLLPGYQGRGIGTLLIQDLLDEAAAHDVPVRLTLIKDNPALRICERLAFGEAVDLGDRVLVTWSPRDRVSVPDAAIS